MKWPSGIEEATVVVRRITEGDAIGTADDSISGPVLKFIKVQATRTATNRQGRGLPERFHAIYKVAASFADHAHASQPAL